MKYLKTEIIAGGDKVWFPSSKDSTMVNPATWQKIIIPGTKISIMVAVDPELKYIGIHREAFLSEA